MHPDVLASLRCPVCRGALTSPGPALRCEAGHAFDVAREGYVSFRVGRPARVTGDGPGMIAARARFLAAGHLDPLAAAIAARAGGAGPGLAVEIGAGTAYHLARALDALPGRAGLAIDVSKHAARHAARAHPRLGAVVADARATLPVADACAGLVLDVFAPRNGAELRRIVKDDGIVIVATPRPEHLAELRPRLGLLEVDPEKERRVEAALGPGFLLASTTDLAWTMTLPREDALAAASMGPTARHVAPDRLAARAAALPARTAVTASIRLAVWRPRPLPSSAPGER